MALAWNLRPRPNWYIPPDKAAGNAAQTSKSMQIKIFSYVNKLCYTRRCHENLS
jgi:hypothetical protein